MKATVHCDRCRAPIGADLRNTVAPMPCPGCGRLLHVITFPALERGLSASSGSGATALDGEAGCFFHPHKKAEVVCDACGRFLCGLCDLAVDGRHICPTCLSSGQRQGRIRSLENHRVTYDGLCLMLAFYPMLLIWLTVATAPAALFMVFRYWNHPTSLLGRGKIRFVLAGILAACQIVGMAVFGYFLITE